MKRQAGSAVGRIHGVHQVDQVIEDDAGGLAGGAGLAERRAGDHAARLRSPVPVVKNWLVMR